ncbi:MAG TPA: MmcQ/YjbR family DNA-binding protein [Bacteroidota bacterium]|jgi:hypothetical protein
MTENQFRAMALSLPEATEASHMDHPDFRVSGKIFATLAYPDKSRGMVKLSPKQQTFFMEEEPDAFTPAQGAWGRQGATYVSLRNVTRKTMKKALEAAWTNNAPKRLSSRVHGQVD